MLAKSLLAELKIYKVSQNKKQSVWCLKKNHKPSSISGGRKIPTNSLCFIICIIISLSSKPNVSDIYTEIQNCKLQHEIYTLKIYGGDLRFLVQNIRYLEVATLP